MNITSWVRLCAIIFISAAIVGCSKSPDSLISDAESRIQKGDYSGAVIQLKSALQQDGTSLRARWLLGEVYLTLELGAEAEKEFRRAKELGVAVDSVLPVLAQALYLQGKSDEILRLEEPSDISDVSRGELAAVRGLALLANGDSSAADSLTIKGMEFARVSSFVISARARVLLASSQIDAAKALLQDLQQKFPVYRPAWSLMGDVDMLQGNYDSAEKNYTKAADLAVVRHLDLMKRAYSRLRQKKFQGALEDAEQVIKSYPKYQPAWYLVGAIRYHQKDFAAAQEALEWSYKLKGDHLQSVILLGLSHLTLGNLAQADHFARRSVALMPGLIPARQLLAAVALRMGKAREAEETIRAVVDAQPDNLAAMNLLANSLIQQAKAEEAAPILERIASATQDNPEIQAKVGLALFEANSSGKGLDAINRALAISPDLPVANAALVSVLLRDQAYDEALATARRLLERKPEDPMALRLVAFTHLARGEDKEAANGLRRVLVVAPGDPKASLALAALVDRRGGGAEANAILREASDKHPDDASLLSALARMAFDEGQVGEAQALLQSAIEKDPLNDLPRVMLARLLMAEGKPREVLSVLPNGTDEADVNVLIQRARAHAGAGDFESARTDFEKVLMMNPDFARAHFELARVFAALGDQARKDKSLERAYELAPSDVEIAVAKARSLASQGDFDAATKLIQGLSTDESHPAIVEVKLFIAERRGTGDESVRLSKKLFEAAPSTSTLQRLVSAYSRFRQFREAETVLTTWLDEHPDDLDATLLLAEVFARTERLPQAVGLLRPLVQDHADNVRLLNNLAWYLADIAPIDALLFAEKAYAGAAGNAAVIGTYAKVLAKAGEVERALAILEQGIDANGQPVGLQVQRIEILALSGERSQAGTLLARLKAVGVPPVYREQVAKLERQLGGSE